MLESSRKNQIDWRTRIEWWLLLHDVPLYADLTTYYMICALVGFIEGLRIGNWMIGAA